MDREERENFWNTLCSLPGNNIESESKRLSGTIRYPKHIYRYRSVNTHNLEALRTNMLYFSSSNYYDDPFDTFLNIDVEKIRNSILTALQNPGVIKSVATSLELCLRENPGDRQINGLNIADIQSAFSMENINKFLEFVMSSREDLKKNIWSVCFSENGFNESLWLKYANCHKGFVVIYDLENTDNFICGTKEQCANCGIYKYGTPIYPIYYSNTPYDATNIAKRVILKKIEQQTGISIPSNVYKSLEGMFWEKERTALIKKECHQYDEEWRMILNCDMKPPIMMEWIPSGIILGLHMDHEEENLVICLAQEAGIKNIFKAYIDIKNNLSYYQIK